MKGGRQTTVPRSLLERGAAGTMWMAATHATVLLSQLGTIAALSRLLSERELGLVTLTLVLANLALLFAGLGLARGLVRMQDPGVADESTAWLGCMLAGATACLGVALGAPAAARFFAAPELHGPFVLCGAIFLVVASFQVSQARLEREMRFRTLGVTQAVGFAIPFAVVTVVTAAWGAGIWCGVIGALAGRTIQALWLLRVGRRDDTRFSPERRAARPLLRFGVHATGAAALAFAVANVDYTIVGKLLGPAALGVYTVAYQLATVPRSRIGQALATVSFAAFAAIQDEPERLNRAYVRLNSYVAFVVFPAMAALFVLAEPIVLVAFGERWLPAVPLVRILCPAGALMAVRSTAGPALNALGRPEFGMYVNALTLVVSSVVLLILTPFGLSAVAFAVLLIAICDFLPLQLILRSLTGLSLGRLLGSLAAPATLAVVLGAALWLVTPGLASAVGRLAIGSTLAIVLYAVLLVPFGQSFMREMLALAVPGRSTR